MKHLKFLQIAAFMTALLSLSMPSTWAQTTVTLPTACNTCTPSTSPSTNGTGAVSSYGAPTCTANAVNGTMTAGTAVSGVTMSLYANVTTLGTYNLSATQNGVTFSGTGTFAALGCQLITLTASGTPTTAGATTWSTNSTPIGSATATVAAAGPSFPAGYVACNGVVTQVVEVTSPTGKIWMDRNLGASQVATSSTDAAADGDLFQWGRFADGHQCRTSSTTSTNATTAVPNGGNTWDGLFILEPNAPYDWLTPPNTSLWQGVSGTNNPCPSGYRLPTETELDAERSSWSSNNSVGAFASPLKLPMAGGRFNSTGSIFAVGTGGYYWSSTVSSTGSRYLNVNSSNATMNTGNRANGFSVRCLKD